MNKLKTLLKNISPLNDRSDMPVILYVIKVVIIFWFVKFGSEIICEALAIALHFACGKNPLQGEMFDQKTITLITYFGYGFMILLAILYWKVIRKKSVKELGFTKKAGTYPVGALTGAILVITSVIITVITGTITYNGILPNIDRVYILLMMGAFICQGAMEEVLCRGIVLQLLKSRTSIPVAAGVSTVLFILPHLGSLSGEKTGIIFFSVVNLILISLVLTFLTVRFKSIWAACGLHSAWNFILYNILGLNLSGNDEMTAAVFDMRSVGSNVINGGSYGIEASVVTTAVLTAFLLLCYVIMCRERNSWKAGDDHGV